MVERLSNAFPAPIRICVSYNIYISIACHNNAMTNSPFQISQNALHHVKMLSCGSMHVLTQ